MWSTDRACAAQVLLCWVAICTILLPTVNAARNDEAYFRGQDNAISIIVATHNNARFPTPPTHRTTPLSGH
jgi:hypothetical protein